MGQEHARVERFPGETRSTRQRAAIRRTLREAGGFLTVSGIHALLSRSGHEVGLTTVYRSLQTLVAAGEVDVVRTGDAAAMYRWCKTPRHHHHLICRGCSRTVEVEDAGMERWAEEVARRHGFSDPSHAVEVFGLCSDCS